MKVKSNMPAPMRKQVRTLNKFLKRNRSHVGVVCLTPTSFILGAFSQEKVGAVIQDFGDFLSSFGEHAPGYKELKDRLAEYTAAIPGEMEAAVFALNATIYLLFADVEGAPYRGLAGDAPPGTIWFVDEPDVTLLTYMPHGEVPDVIEWGEVPPAHVLH